MAVNQGEIAIYGKLVNDTPNGILADAKQIKLSHGEKVEDSIKRIDTELLQVRHDIGITFDKANTAEGNSGIAFDRLDTVESNITNIQTDITNVTNKVDDIQIITIDTNKLFKLTTASTDADIRAALVNYVTKEEIPESVFTDYIYKHKNIRFKTSFGGNLQVEYAGQDYTFIEISKPIAAAAVTCKSIALQCNAGVWSCTKNGQRKGIAYSADLQSTINIANNALTTASNAATSATNALNQIDNLATEVNTKVSKVEGKGLSTNDYTNEDKQKLTDLSLVAQSKELLFQDMWKAWGGSIESVPTFDRVGFGNITSDVGINELRIEAANVPNDFDPTTDIFIFTEDATGITKWNILNYSFTRGAGQTGTFEITLTAEDYMTITNSSISEVGIGQNYTSTPTYIKFDVYMDYAKAVRIYGMRELIDNWNAVFNRWSESFNATTELFEGNELKDITAEQALQILNAPRISYPTVIGCSKQKVRTLILLQSGSPTASLTANLFRDSQYEILRLAADETTELSGATNIDAIFYVCNKLRKIIGTINLIYTTSVNYAFDAMDKLESIKIKNLKVNLSFQNSPLISLESLTYLIENAANTTPITITVHPNVYAKLTGDTSYAVAAVLTPEEAAAWQQLVTDATAKQITFASA